MSKKSTFLNLYMPSDFPSDIYDEIGHRIGNISSLQTDHSQEFTGAWLAIAYRSIACAEYDLDFTKLIQLSGDNPSFQDQYLQEKYLFNFFINGLSTFESTCYALFAIGSHLRPSVFPFTTSREKKKVSPGETERWYKQEFANEDITHLITRVVTSQAFEDWKNARNILIHRVVPGRTIFTSTTNLTRPDIWRNGIVIDTNTTASRRFWLMSQLTSLLTAINGFTQKYFVEK